MTYFEERQHARQPWLVALILGIAALAWGILIQQVGRGKAVGNNPISDWGIVVLWLLAGIGLPAFLFGLRLETRVESDKITIRLRPFTTREIQSGQIARFYARSYKPLREYGGWGVRGFGANRAYNMSGDQGMQLELVDGSRVLIGTQRPRELETAIAKMTDRPPSLVA
jgi:hypothetical protein